MVFYKRTINLSETEKQVCCSDEEKFEMGYYCHLNHVFNKILCFGEQNQISYYIYCLMIKFF